MDRVRQWLAHRSHADHTLIGIGLFVIVAFAKAAAGPDVGFSAVAMLPVAYVTWFVSRRAGAIVAIASAVTLFATNLLILHRYSTSLVDLWNASMDMAVFAILVWSLSETKALYLRTRQLAGEDPLTQLLNRRAFLEALRLESRRARRYHEPLTIAYIDLDGFKRINDTGGHAAGDRCLNAIACTLKRVVREVDVVGRLGGDEFAIVLTRTGGNSSSRVLADIAAELRRVDAGACPRVSVSIGAITFTDPDDDPEDMLGAADGLMYVAKRSGKDRLVHQQR